MKSELQPITIRTSKAIHGLIESIYPNASGGANYIVTSFLALRECVIPALRHKFSSEELGLLSGAIPQNLPVVDMTSRDILLLRVKGMDEKLVEKVKALSPVEVFFLQDGLVYSSPDAPVEHRL